MKKELRILVILIAVLLVGTVGYYFMPKKFGKNVNPSEVDHINVFDGNTGTGFTYINLYRFYQSWFTGFTSGIRLAGYAYRTWCAGFLHGYRIHDNLRWDNYLKSFFG